MEGDDRVATLCIGVDVYRCIGTCRVFGAIPSETVANGSDGVASVTVIYCQFQSDNAVAACSVGESMHRSGRGGKVCSIPSEVVTGGSDSVTYRVLVYCQCQGNNAIAFCGIG